jgi:predicted dehydrogenase
VAGSTGAVWTEGDTVKVGGPTGTRVVDVPDDLAPVAPIPPPSDLMQTAYDLLHSTGMDLEPYTRLARAFRSLIEGEPIAPDPVPATFADGVATVAVTDAVRASADAGGEWVAVALT